MQSQKSQSFTRYQLSATVLEVCNEDLFDLLQNYQHHPEKEKESPVSTSTSTIPPSSPYSSSSPSLMSVPVPGVLKSAASVATAAAGNLGTYFFGSKQQQQQVPLQQQSPQAMKEMNPVPSVPLVPNTVVIQEDGNGEVQWTGVQEIAVETPEDVMR
jgi:hypothetical protein